MVVKRLVVVVCAAMLLAGCAAPLNAEKSARMAEYMELCESNGGTSDYNAAAGFVKCEWNLNKEES